MTQEQHTESSSRNLIVGITFVIGSAIGVLAVIAIQGFLPKSEIASYDFNEMEVQQGSSKNFYRSANEQSVVPRKFEEIFKHRSPAKHYKALYNTLSHSTEQELKEWWTQTQKIERTSHREVAQQVVLRNLTEINPQEALQLLNDASTLQWDALSETIFSVWAAIHLDDAIEAAAKLERAKRNVALKAILRARDDLSDDKRRLIAVQLERVFTYERFVSEANALQSTTDPGKSWDTLLNDNVDDARQIAALAIVADQWREQIGFEVMSKIYHSGIEDYAIKRLLISAIAQADPALALKFVQGVSEETERSYMSQIIVEQWASTDPLAALGAVSSFKPSSLYIELEGTVGAFWAKNNPYELIQNIELLTWGSRVWPLEVAFSYIARENPLEAIESLSTIKSFVGNTNTILRRIIDEWGVQQPEAATDWLLNNFDQQKDPLLLHSLMEEVLPSLALQDPIKAFEIALEHPNPISRFGLELRVIWQLTADDKIDTALSLLPRVSEESQAAAYSNVGSALVRKGQTFEALELGSHLESRHEQSYFRHVIQAWARSDATDLYETLEELPSSAVQSIAASELLTRHIHYGQLLSDDQLERVRSLLNSDDNVRVQVLEKIERR